MNKLFTLYFCITIIINILLVPELLGYRRGHCHSRRGSCNARFYPCPVPLYYPYYPAFWEPPYGYYPYGFFGGYPGINFGFSIGL